MMKTVRNQLSKSVDLTSYMLCREYEKELAFENGFIPIYENASSFKSRVGVLKHRVIGKLYKIATGKNRPWYFPFPFKQIKQISNKLDAVIDVSGFAYADSWGAPLILETTKLIKICKKKGIAFYFLPQAWGSFDLPKVAKAARKMLELADGFYARDHLSRAHIAKLLSRTHAAVPLLHDIAFIFEERYAFKNNVAEEPLDKKLVFGISPNLRVYEKAGGKNENNEYLKLLNSVCDHILAHYDAHILLIPNEVFPDTATHIDDRFLCRKIAKHINQAERCTVIEQYASAEDIKAHIGSVDVLISSRYHALIFGFIQGKPSMAISWSHKYCELFRLFDQQDFVVELDSLDSSAVINLLEKLIDQRDTIGANIENRLPHLRNPLKDMFSQFENL